MLQSSLFSSLPYCSHHLGWDQSDDRIGQSLVKTLPENHMGTHAQKFEIYVSLHDKISKSRFSHTTQSTKLS